MSTLNSNLNALQGQSVNVLPSPIIPSPAASSTVPAAPCKTSNTDKSLLREASSAGQRAREELLKDKTIVVVACGNDLNKKVIYENLHSKHRLKIYLLEEPDNTLAHRLNAAGSVVHLPVDLAPRPTLLDDCVQTIKNNISQDISGVLTFWDDAVALTSRIAASLHLQANSKESIDTAHDKYASRRALQDAGLPCPRVTLLKDFADFESKRDDISYPCVLKPVQGAASIGVYVCQNETELRDNLKKGFQLLDDIYSQKELMGLVFDDADANCVSESSDLQSFVCEEFIDGPEVDIDCICSNGEVVYAKVSDDWDYVQPWYCEIGVNYPSHLSDKIKEEFVVAIKKVINTFGITMGVLHCEMKYSSKYGPVLIEVNPRLGGGPCSYFHNELYGVDLATEHVLTSCGIWSNPLPKTPTSWGIGLLLYPQKSGTVSQDIETTDNYKDISSRKYVTKLQLFQKKGDTVVGWHDGYPSHLGLLMCEIPMVDLDYTDAVQYVESLRTEIDVPLL